MSLPEIRRIYVERPRCEDCGSVKLRVGRTVTTKDESRIQYTRCNDCGASYVVVSTPKEFSIKDVEFRNKRRTAS